jgi:hypothetical protein
MPITITMKIQQRKASGRKLEMTFTFQRSDKMTFEDMKALWQVEQQLNTLLPGGRFHIDVNDAPIGTATVLADVAEEK